MDLDLQKIGARVKSARIAKNITQQQLADSAGISVSTVRAVEKGKCIMRLRALIGITDALDISIDSLSRDDSPEITRITEKIVKKYATLTPEQQEKFLQSVQELKQKRQIAAI